MPRNSPPAVSLTWILEPSACAEMESSLDGATVRVCLPAHDVNNWAATDTVGLYGHSSALEISVEKDFQCLHRAGSPEEIGAFPNPAKLTPPGTSR